MITARLFCDGERICAFEVKGHSGYAREGADIVCAAVSAIAQTALIGLKEVLRLPVMHEIDEKRGLLSVKLPPDTISESQVLLQTMKRALKAVESDYPGYIRVICEKWRNSK